MEENENVNRGNRAKQIELVTDNGVIDLCELDDVIKQFMAEQDLDVQDGDGNQLIYASSANKGEKYGR